MRGRRRTTGRDPAWWLRAYAGAAGVVLMALGVVGLLLPGPGPAGSLFRGSVGALFAYAGLVQCDPIVTRRFVGGVGVLLLLGAGASTFARLLLWGEAGGLGPVEATCLAVGLPSVMVARRAEPGVLLAALSTFGGAVRAAVAGAVWRVRRRRRGRAPARGPEDVGGRERRGGPGGSGGGG